MNEHKHITDLMCSEGLPTRIWKSRFAAARFAYEAGKFRECESLLYRELELAKDLPDEIFAENCCYVALGALYSASSRTAEALENLRLAVKQLSGRSEPPLLELYAVALRVLSRVMVDSGDFKTAEIELATSERILVSLGANAAVQLSLTLSEKAGFKLLQGHLGSAKEILIKAMSILENTVGKTSHAYEEAAAIYAICDASSETDVLNQTEKSIYKLRFDLGQCHPFIKRAVSKYIQARKSRGEEAEATEAIKLFS